MNCTKPITPYISILAFLFTLSWMGAPTQTKSTRKNELELSRTNANEAEGKLKQIELISMLNTEEYD